MKTKKVKVTVTILAHFKKSEKCKCLKPATHIVIASFKNEHRHIFCCSNQKCLEKARNIAIARLFRGPRPLSIEPERFIRAEAKIVNTFSITIEQ